MGWTNKVFSVKFTESILLIRVLELRNRFRNKTRTAIFTKSEYDFEKGFFFIFTKKRGKTYIKN